MRAVGSSEVTIDWATGLATRKSATAAESESARIYSISREMRGRRRTVGDVVAQRVEGEKTDQDRDGEDLRAGVVERQQALLFLSFKGKRRERDAPR